ncbi:hypothetical protein PUN28_013051 [Cardiocondyla obscurior]|uniref:Uncharacterized protein n=1 Tax=Cardiocondyla obscurior TaxID=286306 RepID=A0AAW2F7Z9_9HYME
MTANLPRGTLYAISLVRVKSLGVYQKYQRTAATGTMVLFQTNRQEGKEEKSGTGRRLNKRLGTVY